MSKNNKCPEALTHTVNETTGKCRWCGRQIDRGYNPRPAPPRGAKANIDLAYEYFFDPDFGSNRHDNYTGDA